MNAETLTIPWKDMCPMNKLIKDQWGLTLIELLGAFVIMIIIGALAFPILGNGMKAAESNPNRNDVTR